MGEMGLGELSAMEAGQGAAVNQPALA